MGLPCRVRVNYRGYAVAVHRRLCYPHVTSAAVVYGGRGYWTNGQRTCLTRSRKTLRLLQHTYSTFTRKATPGRGRRPCPLFPGRLHGTHHATHMGHGPGQGPVQMPCLNRNAPPSHRVPPPPRAHTHTPAFDGGRDGPPRAP